MTEALISLIIIAGLVAILVPVFNRVKRSIQIRSSVEKMKQIYVAIEIYRNDYGGVENYDHPKSYYLLGLPTSNYWSSTLFGLPEEAWKSPCGKDETLWYSGWVNLNGWIDYASEYEPKYFTRLSCWHDSGPPNRDPNHYDADDSWSANYLLYKDYLAKYRQNAVVLKDVFCNEPGTSMYNPYITKRALAILLSGQVVNRLKKGYAHYLFWYSDPPE